MMPPQLSRFLTRRLVLLVSLFFLGCLPIAVVYAAPSQEDAAPNEGAAPAFSVRLPNVMNSEVTPTPEPLPPVEFEPIVPRISAGSLHTCALTEENGLYCWGSADTLGDGVTHSSATPVAASGLGSGVRAVFAGDIYTCALLENGTVQCWGASYQQDPFQTASVAQTSVPQGKWHGNFSPITINGFSAEVASISVDMYGFGCAVLVTGIVQCWGISEQGHTPVLTNELWEGGVVKLARGENHICALLQDGRVKCLGNNEYKQLGDGTVTRRETPVFVQGLEGRAVSIAAGAYNTCVLLENGKVQCWGKRIEKEYLGGLPPTVIEGFTSRVVAIDMGYDHRCALMESGEVACWGRNLEGQLGLGTLANDVFAKKVPNVEGAVAIALGKWHTCALLSDDRIQCWGDNSYYQAGDVLKPILTTPVAVVGLQEKVVELYVLGNSSCGIFASGKVSCWGRHTINPYGGSLPRLVTELRDEKPVSLAGEEHEPCAVYADGTYYCWNIYTDVPRAPSPNLLPGPVKVFQGSCILLQNGSVYCLDQQLKFSQSPGLESGVIALDLGGYGVCALMENGGMKCWGPNDHGQVGNGTPFNQYNPVDVIGLGGPVKKIALGERLSCALLESGAVQCWGYNVFGQVGDGTTTDRYNPTNVVGLDKDVIDIASYANHSCALLANKSVRCWGANESGQLGNGNQSTQTTPVEVQGLPSGVVELEVGLSHSCVLVESGEVYCWGLRDMLGEGVEYKRRMLAVYANWPPEE